MNALFQLESVTAHRGTNLIAKDLNLRIDEGEVVALLGPSGAGKSSLLRLLLGLSAPERGIVRIRQRIASANGRILVPPEGRGLSVVFQQLALWPHLTVEGNLNFVLSRRIPRVERKQRIAQILERVGLADHQRRRPSELSGGEQQRVAIARALVSKPSAILLDEPLRNLDLPLQAELLVLFQSLLAEQRVAALYVTHDPRQVQTLTRRLLVLEGGHIVQEGSLEQLQARPRTRFVRRLTAAIS